MADARSLQRKALPCFTPDLTIDSSTAQWAVEWELACPKGQHNLAESKRAEAPILGVKKVEPKELDRQAIRIRGPREVASNKWDHLKIRGDLQLQQIRQQQAAVKPTEQIHKTLPPRLSCRAQESNRHSPLIDRDLLTLIESSSALPT